MGTTATVAPGRPHRAIRTLLGLLAAAAALLVLVTQASAAPSRAAATDAHLWLTTPDGQYKLTDMGTVPFGAATPTAVTAVVDPSRTFQTMSGFGGAITDSSAVVLYRLSPTARNATMRSLFDPRTGDGLSYLRQPIGASDFVATRDYTYDDMPAGQTDYRQRHFSIAHDRGQDPAAAASGQAPEPAAADRGQPVEPAGVDEDQRLAGRRPADRQPAYLPLLRAVPDEVRARPTGRRASRSTRSRSRTSRRTAPRPATPGTDMPSWQEEKVIEALGPMLHAAHLGTKILAYDHNWSEHPNDIASTPPDETADVNDYPQQVLSSRAARWISGTAYHCYFGDPSAMSALHDAVPGQGHLLHRVLRKPVQRPREHVLATR